MRAFVAVELPQKIREAIAVCIADLKSAGADVKWVETGNLHLTLKFLGEITKPQAAQLKEALMQTAAGLSSFTLRIEGIGAFPRTTSPRVIWLGVREGEKSLAALAERVEETCVGLGFKKGERPFSAHLTIGRVRSRERLAPLIKRLQLAEFCATEPAPVEKITLFQSLLSPKGSSYVSLAEIRLGSA